MKQIIVTELRDMSAIPDLSESLATYGLIYFDYTPIPSFAVFTTNGWNISLSGSIGWIPMPIYKPKVES